VVRFERSNIWIRSKNLAVDVYKNTDSLDDFGFRNQITRSILSVSSNIAEGMERNSDKDLGRFLVISKASCAEFKAQLLIAREIGYVDEDLSLTWLDEVNQIARMIGAFLKTLDYDRSAG